MEFMQGGNLANYLKRHKKLKPQQAKLITAEILYGLMGLHKYNIIYRDLKPQNIMLDSQGHIKIIDFNLSKSVQQNSFNYSFCGTDQYLAPEIQKHLGYNISCDYWNLGCIVFLMLEGYLPFSNNKSLDFTLHFKSIKDKTIISFVKGLLEENPKQRLGYKNINQIMHHDIFNDVDFDLVKNKQYDLQLKLDLKHSLDLKYFNINEREIEGNKEQVCMSCEDNKGEDIFSMESTPLQL